MLYTNISKEMQRCDEKDCALMIADRQPEYRWSASGCSSYWKKDSLVEFCNFIDFIYSSDDGVQKLQQKWNNHIQNNQEGGICDMTLIWLFYEFKNRKNIAILSEVYEESCFDDNINSSENRYENEYKMNNGIKEIKWENDIPYCYNILQNKWIRFNTIHFQGSAKSLL